MIDDIVIPLCLLMILVSDCYPIAATNEWLDKIF